jgi:hypothetical protein
MVSNPFQSFLKRLLDFQGQRRFTRQTRRSGRLVDLLRPSSHCHAAVETLEDRLLLSASSLTMNPPFRLSGLTMPLSSAQPVASSTAQPALVTTSPPTQIKPAVNAPPTVTAPSTELVVQNGSTLADPSSPENAPELSASPTVIGPSAEAVRYNSSYEFLTGNGFHVADSSLTASSDTLTLAVNHGVLTFNSTSGLTFQNGTSNGSSLMTVAGSLANMNTALVEGLVYTPTTGYSGTDTLQVILSDPSDSQEAADDVALTVSSTPGPNIYGPYGFSLNENSSYVPIDNITVMDPAASGTDSVTLSVGDGKVALGLGSGVVITSGANGSSSMTVSGTMTSLIEAIQTFAYEPNPGFSGTDYLRMSINDSGDNLSGSSVVWLLVYAPPSVTAPANASVAENSSYTFSNAISFADPDTAGGYVLTLAATEGTITLGSTTGLIFTSGSNGSPSMTFEGTAFTYLNDALSRVTYTPNAGYSGPDSLQISVYDYGDYQSASATVAITVNDPASVTAPAAVSVNENASYAFGGTISLTDTTATGASDSLSLSVTNGTLSLGSTAGLTFGPGSDGSSSMTVTGTLGDLNASLNGLQYSPSAGFSGADSLHLALDNSVSNLTASAVVSLTVNAPPAISAPAKATLNENTSFTFGGAIGLTDASASGTSDSLSLSVSDGTLTLGSTTGIAFGSGANASSSMTITGTFVNLNAAVAGLVYAPNPGYSGSDSMQISLKDSGDGLSGSGSVAITVNALAPPSVAAPSNASLKENSTYGFSGAAISVTDATASGTSDSLTLSVTNGKLSLGSTTGLTFSSGSNNSSSMTVTGTLANLNAALNGLVYTPTPGFSGRDSLAISINDSIDKLTGSAAVAIAVDPYVTAPPTASVLENGTYSFSASAADPITVTDGAASGTSDSLTLTVLHGKLTLASIAGLTFTSGANGSSSITVTGTLANLNAALNGLVYAPATGYTGSDTLTVGVTDPGDGLSGSAIVAITVAQKRIVTAVAIASGPMTTADDESDQWAGVSAAVDMLNE